MARILMAWELGEAFGHLAPCLRVAEGLGLRGHTVVLALKDVRLPAGTRLPRGTTLVQAPWTPVAASPRPPPVNYADVLRHSGFGEASGLAARLQAWRGLIALARPDAVAADHAPTALLAAHLAGISHLAFGISFSIPAAVRPWTSIRPWEEVSAERLVDAERQLDRAYSHRRSMIGHRTPVAIRDLFGPHDVLNTFAELDHYGERLQGRHVGPIVSLPRARPVAWQDAEATKALVYLRPEVPGFLAIVQALGQIDAEVVCVSPGLSVDKAKRLATRRLRISLVPVDLPPLLAHADLAVSYGGSGFVTQALLAGAPLLLRPRYVEQALLAHRVEAMGAGRLISDARADGPSVSALTDEVLHSPGYREAARAFRERYRHFSPEQAVEQTVAAIENRLLGKAANAPGQPQERWEGPPACLH